MTTVRDTFIQIERQCLGTDVPCIHGHMFREWHGHCSILNIQYEVNGPGGGIYNLTIEPDGRELSEGPSTAPDVIVRTSVEDWLALWAGREPAWALLQSGRISVVTVGQFTMALQVAGKKSTAEFPRDLPLLGVLGPLRESEDPPLTRVTSRWKSPPDEPTYPPSLDRVQVAGIRRFRLDLFHHEREGLFTYLRRMGLFRADWYPPGTDAHRLAKLGGSEWPSEVRLLLGPIARLSAWVALLDAVRVGLLFCAIASVPVGVGVGFFVGWEPVLWTWLVLLPSPYLARKAVGYLEGLRAARLRAAEDRLLTPACQGPRFFRLLVECGLIEYVPSRSK